MMQYKTAAKEVTVEFTEKRSQFLGHIKPVSTEQEAIDFINAKREKYWDATHNVYAYILRGGAQRYSDDGEPHGTAGMPALQVLQKEGLTDIAVVVTRYFGGILLGAGGLVRAYAKSVKQAVDTSGIVTMRMCLIARISCDYSFYSTLLREIEHVGAEITDTVFAGSVEVTFVIKHEDIERLNTMLADDSAGTYKAEITGEKYVGVKE